MKSEDLPGLLLASMLLVILAFISVRTAADPDLWGHVRFGQDILAARFVPRVDTYSFTSDRPWINHEWLAEVLMALAYGAAGGAGLIALKCILAASAFTVLWRTTRRAGVHRPFAAVLLAAAAFGAMGLLFTIRPQLFSLLLFAALLALLNGIGRGSYRLFLWMPALFALWANLHGGWIVGLGVLTLWCLCGLPSRRVRWGWAAAGLLLGLLGTLATPYGSGLWEFLLETVRVGRPGITEWQTVTGDLYSLASWTVGSLLIVVAWRRRRWAAAQMLIPSAVLGVLAFRVVRLQGFFVLAGAFLLAPYVAGLGPAKLPLSRRPTRGEIALVGVFCLAGAIAAGVAVQGHATCISLAGPAVQGAWEPEAEAVVFLRTNPIEGRLLTYFDYGEIAIWHLSPKLLVSYDGRRETVYSESVRNAHDGFYSSEHDAGYARFLKADYVWLPRKLPVIVPLELAGWVAIFRGPTSVVFARQARPYRQPAPWAGPRCFPGP